MSLALLSPLRPDQADAAFAAPSVVVMKFGSSVLRSPADAPKVASDIYAQVRQGRRVVAVVSAFEGETDRLLAEARTLGLPHDNPLLPAYVAMGEERAAALTALACDRVGLDALALSVRDLGLVAEGPLEHARPLRLEREALDAALLRHEVVVVPGFGALSPEGKVVLLGRGGSDLTALFLAAELGLEAAQLVKDVDGLYDRDPNADPDARRYDQASWSEARFLGGGLVQPDAIDLAEARGLRIEVRNHEDGHRTVIGPDSAPPRAPLPHRRLRVALAGCGVVGGGALSRLLDDPRVEVVGVLVRDPARPRDVPGADAARLKDLLVADAAALLDCRPDVVLEALSEADAGYDLIHAALERGVDVASANKQAVSRDPAGLLALANAHGARLLWSASIGGGVPMVESLRAAQAEGPVAGFEAVLNGTVNFMLERLGAGAGFDRALAEARAAGFAEEDPSSDLEGLDAAAKVRLLAFEAFGQMPDAADIARDVLSADALPPAGARQLCRCRLEGGKVVGEVRLVSGPMDALFATLKGEGNALKVLRQDGSFARCRGRGAGRWPTAESLLADLSELAAGRLALRVA
ncbi:amino acid kinase family protein [Brevundimonas sp. Root1279]|uniref:amino acid kinase family protein n=1 Tax=Brevundimonas sp. Root1279 TaxID=1736443 RepID=UPI0006FB0232|nr:homoserine dehydrogenase [Brevundimonas sp. Root1279]KQW80846.1 homoserine dehydrogenase [Brevundimonas sp. Root1279]